MLNPSSFACPLDGLPLIRTGNSFRCSNAHSYDIARQGYINLLPVQNKRSRDPGDSKEMVMARQEFLAADYYKPIAHAVSESVKACVRGNAPIAVLDAGCGEGYYLRKLRHSGLPLHLIGLDISKWAIIAATRQDKNIAWLVASNANIPLLPDTQDVVLCMFGFPVYGEFARVLKRDGILIKVDSGPDHLLELREIIYPSIKPAANTPESPAGFTLLEQRALRYTIKLNSQQHIAQLLAMTPHLYRTSAEGRERAAALKEITLTIDVRINWMKTVPVPRT